jgi:hypothetical protein
MEIDKKHYRELLLWVFDMVAKLEKEVTAHQVAFYLLKQSGHFPELDKILEECRKNPPPKLIQRHKEINETIERLLGEEKPEEDLMKFLREWKPKGPSN